MSNINNSENQKKRLFRNIILTLLIATGSLPLNSCAKTVPCDIEGEHAHYYVSENDIGRYIISEKSEKQRLKRTKNYKMVNEEEKKLLKFMDKERLFRIDENKESIEKITSELDDYIMFEYEYHSTVYISSGNGMSIPVQTTNTDWTSNPHHSDLTGEIAQLHYVYRGCKVTKEKNGKYKITTSEAVDDLSQLPKGYDYISSYSFYDTVVVGHKKLSKKGLHEFIQDYERQGEKSKTK